MNNTTKSGDRKELAKLNKDTTFAIIDLGVAGLETFDGTKAELIELVCEYNEDYYAAILCEFTKMEDRDKEFYSLVD